MAGTLPLLHHRCTGHRFHALPRGRPHRHALHPGSGTAERGRQGSAAHQVQGGWQAGAVQPGEREPALGPRDPLHGHRGGDGPHVPGRPRGAVPHGRGRATADRGPSSLPRGGGERSGLQPAGTRGRPVRRGGGRRDGLGRGAGHPAQAPGAAWLRTGDLTLRRLRERGAAVRLFTRPWAASSASPASRPPARPASPSVRERWRRCAAWWRTRWRTSRIWSSTTGRQPRWSRWWRRPWRSTGTDLRMVLCPAQPQRPAPRRAAPLLREAATAARSWALLW